MSSFEYLLGGGPIEQFPDNVLPTLQDVLRLYINFWGKRGSDSTKESFVAKALMRVYEGANIPTLSELTIKKKINKCILEFRKILKFKSKSTRTAENIEDEMNFRAKLEEIFEIRRIIPTNNTIEIPEGPDDLLVELNEAVYLNNTSEYNGNVQLFGNSSASAMNFDNEFVQQNDNNRTDSSDPNFEGGQLQKEHIPKEILWQMFGTGVSFRSLSKVLNLAYASVNTENRYHISPSYLYKQYQRFLQEKEIKYQEQIREDISYGSICFDHQNTRRITGKFEGNTHRVAIVWYSNNKHKVIGMPEMPNKAANSQTSAILETCDEFGIQNVQIVAIVCDNEVVNIGIHGGTCVQLEASLEKYLLRLMCRHHILEIVVKDVYFYLFGSDAPNNIFYTMLKEEWADLREAEFPFTPFNEDSFIGDGMNAATRQLFERLKTRALDDLRKHSSSKHIRDDYREVTLLALKFFGENKRLTKSNQVKFRTLINPSHARFMATIIQSIQLYLFRRNFEWNTRELQQFKNNLIRFTTFASLIYIRFWNRCVSLFDAPVNDLDFLQELQTYQLFDEPIAKVATLALNRHLCYMGHELAPLSLFSDKVSAEEKNKISTKLLSAQENETPLRNINGNDIAYCEGITDPHLDWSSKSVSDLIGDRSQFLFDTMNISSGFLRSDARTWNRNAEYNKAKKTIQSSLICINDASERVISNCKSKLNAQRCRKETTFRQNMLNLHLDPNV